MKHTSYKLDLRAPLPLSLVSALKIIHFPFDRTREDEKGGVK